nr:MAG TPA: hypothetical protein [Caudoviricetes sp.]
MTHFIFLPYLKKSLIENPILNILNIFYKIQLHHIQ